MKKSTKYWLAKVFDNKKNYPEALRLYHEYCVLSGRKGKYFPAAIFDSGVVFYKTSDFKNAAENFEYVVKNGALYSESDYYSAFLKLADSYNNSGNAKKTLALYSKVEKRQIPSVVFYALTEYAGDASLYDEDIATFSEDEVYDQKDAAGFINLFGLPLKVRAQMLKKVKDNK